MNEILSNYEKLNAQGKYYVDIALKAVMSQPANLLDTPEEELQEIKRQQEETESARKIEEEKDKRYFEELKAECKGFSKEDYLTKLNEVFSNIETYKVRYFYNFTMAKLEMIPDGK